MVGWRDWILGGLLVGGVAAVFLSWNLGTMPLLDGVEARHAQIAREMLEGDSPLRFLTPTLAGGPDRANPPGYSWVLAVAYLMGGTTAVAARAVSVLAALLLLVTLYVFAARRDHPAAGLGAAFVTLSCMGFVILARLATPAMLLTTCVTLGILSGLAWLDQPSPRGRLRGPYIAAALAMLLQGPIGLVLVWVPLVVAIVTRRRDWEWSELNVGGGLTWLGVLAGLPFIAIVAVDPQYGLSVLSLRLDRFMATIPASTPLSGSLPFWVLLVAAPWAVWVVPALWRARRDPDAIVYLIWLATAGVLGLSARGALVEGLLPALPAFGLLVGPALARTADGERTDDEEEPHTGDRGMRAAGWLHVALLGFVAFGATTVGVSGESAGAAVLLIAVMGWWMALTVVALRQELTGAVPPIVLASVLTGVPAVLNLIGPVIGAQYSARDAAALAERAGVGTVLTLRNDAPSLRFYSPVRVIRIDDPSGLHAYFAGNEPIMLVIDARDVMEVQRELGSLAHRWLDRGRRQVFGNRPPPA